MTRGRHFLPLCICASLAAHLAILLYAPGLPAPSVHRPGDAGLMVTLTRASVSAQPKAAGLAVERPASSPLPQRDTTTAPENPDYPPRETITDVTQTTTTAAHASHPADPVTAEETRIPSGSPLLAQLHAAMQPYFHYPLLARRRGWEGTVQVGLRISARGEIIQLRILKTSQHAVLDAAAIDCLSKIGQVPGAMAWLAGQESDIVLPVEYRLTDS